MRSWNVRRRSVGAVVLVGLLVSVPQVAQADPSPTSGLAPTLGTAPTSGPAAGGTLVSVPVRMTFTAVAASGGHSESAYGLGPDGSLYSWGDNGTGQLGDGTDTDRWVPVPVDMSAFPGVSFQAVAANEGAGYGLGSDGAIYSWGSNWHGKLGDGTDTDRWTPVRVDMSAFPGVSFQAVAAYQYAALGLGSDGAIYSWGRNQNGRLGNGTDTDSWTPVRVDMSAFPGVSFRAVAAGLSTGYGLGSDGAIYSWGSNWQGQLGDGTNTDSWTPVRVDMSAFPGVSFQAVAARHSSAHGLGSDGSIYSWGDNQERLLGDGTTIDRWVPVRTTTTAPMSFQAVAPGVNAVYGLGSDGHIYSWDDSRSGQRVEMSGLSGMSFRAVAAGWYSGYGLGADGNIYSWGANGRGQLGDGTNIDSPVPVQVQAPEVTVLDVTFDGESGTGLAMVDGAWTVVTPPGTGTVDVVVSYRLDLDPPGTVRTVTYPDGFVYLGSDAPGGNGPAGPGPGPGPGPGDPGGPAGPGPGDPGGPAGPGPGDPGGPAGPGPGDPGGPAGPGDPGGDLVGPGVPAGPADPAGTAGLVDDRAGTAGLVGDRAGLAAPGGVLAGPGRAGAPDASAGSLAVTGPQWGASWAALLCLVAGAGFLGASRSRRRQVGARTKA